ncbi:MAG: phosphoglycerate mutase family protein [Acidobacteriota bacterium]|nr:phosphoglycerate mutase family protein [Acidobacteriota bacterium]
MAEAAQPGPTTVILVRHAEKAAEPRRDPPLTAQGEARARWLGEVLSRAEVGHIYSTDTLRTRSTAGLMAEALGLEVTVLPPRDLEAMAVALRSHPGEVVLSVGHSNTLGPLAELLGGEPLAPIAEDDYEGFYVLTLGEDGASTLPLQLSLPAQKEPAQKSPAAQR